MKNKKNIMYLVYGALFATLCCISTMAITIPTPTGGYVHAGDSFVILAGIFLGPLYGGLAAGIGSMLSDLFLGYSSYLIATFLIKFAAAALCAVLFRALTHIKLTRQQKGLRIVICGFSSSLVVILGYFIFEWLLTDNLFTAALSGITGNAVQGLASIVISSLLYTIIPKQLIQNI